MAYRAKLVKVQDPLGDVPNGTGFASTTSSIFGKTYGLSFSKRFWPPPSPFSLLGVGHLSHGLSFVSSLPRFILWRGFVHRQTKERPVAYQDKLVKVQDALGDVSERHGIYHHHLLFHKAYGLSFSKSFLATTLPLLLGGVGQIFQGSSFVYSLPSFIFFWRGVARRQTKERLVAYQGKLVKVQDALGDVPNGTGFAITTSSAPDLDATNLVVGRVVDGMDLVTEIAGLPAVKANTGSAFFQ